MCSLNAKMGGNTLSQLCIDGCHARLTIHRQESVSVRDRLEFFLDFRLVHDERLKKVVRKTKIATGFPIAYCVGLPEFSFEGRFRADIEPERKIGPQSHFIEPVQIVALNSSRGRASNLGVKVPVGQDNKI